MTTTTQISSNAAATLTGHMNATLTLDDYAGEHAADYDMDAANAAYRAEVEAILANYRPDWTITGDSICGPAPAAELTEGELAGIREAIAEIDAADILDKHER